MSSRHRASYTKRRKNILVEKLSDNSNNSSSSDEEKNPKSIKKKIRPRRKKADFEEKEQENKVRYFPNQSIFYPELFLENLEIINRFKCGLCEHICENPRFQTCGCDQIYCEKCLNIFYDIYHHQCPKCQNETKELNPSDGFIETLMNLRMRCCNYKNNCNWVGVYKEFKIHKTKNCPKEIINCPNKDCCYKDLRENMPTHTEKCEYRDYFCRDCLDKIPYFEKRVHKNYCPKAKIFCPQGCGESIEREEISEHKKECINSEIQCPFKIFGCRDKFKRSMKDERLIQDTNKHLNLTAKVVFELKNQIKKMQKTIDELQKNNINNRNNNDNINNNDQENNIHIPEDNNINKKDKDIKFLEKKRETIDSIPDNMFPQNNFHFSIFDGDIINNNNNNAILNSEIESDDYIYDVPNDSNDLFFINNDIIETKYLDGKKHHFIFFNKRYDIPKDSPQKYSFTVKLLKSCNWMVIGIGDKKIIEENNYQFDQKKNNSGMYYINVNQVIWNCNSIKQCIIIKCEPLSRSGTTIMCTVDPKQNNLDFILNTKDFQSLTNVKCFKSNNFSPFLVFLHNCKIQTIFNYK